MTYCYTREWSSANYFIVGNHRSSRVPTVEEQDFVQATVGKRAVHQNLQNMYVLQSRDFPQ